MSKKNFAIRKDLMQHILSVHEGMKPNLCTICGKSFTTKNNMNVHIRKVHELRKKNYSCDLCESSFYKAYELDRHIKWHHNIDCNFCGSKFRSNKELKLHVKTVHEREKNNFLSIK